MGGTLYFGQYATGGAGGAAVGGPTAVAGVGGKAKSVLVFDDTTGQDATYQSAVQVHLHATGGAGGYSYGVSASGGVAKAKGALIGAYSAYVSAEGVGGAGGAGNYRYGGDGAAGVGKAKATGDGADAYGSGVGGAGGAASGYGNQAGAGGAGVADARAVSTTAAGATARASQYGGAGGAGYNGANGGGGTASTLYNAVAGSTDGGDLVLVQKAVGGAGGASAGDLAGSGGAAQSYLAFDDTANPYGSAGVQVTSGAYGGAGGAGSLGSGANGGRGDATLVLTGAQTVNGVAKGYGGAGGAGSTGGYGSPGYGGDGRAVTKVYGAAVSAESYARGGAGYRAGSAVAKTKASGSSGGFSASAYSAPAAGQLITYGAALAYGQVDGVIKAKAKMGVGGYAQGFTYQAGAVAQQEAAPNAASVTAVMTANANIAAAFGASPSIFSIDEFGGSYAKSGGTGPQTITDSVTLGVDLTQVSPLGDLIVGFFNPVATGTAFTSLTFTLVADGDTASPLISETFTTVADADAFFADTAIDLGSLASGALSGNPLTLTATFTLTTDAPGSGYYVQMIAGDPPAAARPQAPPPASASPRPWPALAGEAARGARSVARRQARRQGRPGWPRR